MKKKNEWSSGSGPDDAPIDVTAAAALLTHPPARLRDATAIVVPGQTLVRYEPVHWSEVPGWQIDQTQEAWAAFVQSCAARNVPAALKPPCHAARSLTVSNSTQAREFFEK